MVFPIAIGKWNGEYIRRGLRLLLQEIRQCEGLQTWNSGRAVLRFFYVPIRNNINYQILTLWDFYQHFSVKSSADSARVMTPSKFKMVPKNGQTLLTPFIEEVTRA